MLRIRRALIVLSMIWLLTAFAFLASVGGNWGEFFFLYTLFGLLPVIVINGLWWVFFE